MPSTGAPPSKARATLVDLPAEALGWIHAYALSLEFPLVCSTIHSKLSDAPAEAKAHWMIGRFKDVFRQDLVLVLHNQMGYRTRDKSLGVRRECSSFILSHRVARSSAVLREIFRRVIIKADSIFRLFRTMPLDPCDFLLERTLPAEVIHFLFHLQPPFDKYARKAYIACLKRGDFNAAEATALSGLIPTQRILSETEQAELLLLHDGGLIDWVESWAKEPWWNGETQEEYACVCGWKVDPTLFSLRLWEPVPYIPISALRGRSLPEEYINNRHIETYHPAHIRTQRSTTFDELMQRYDIPLDKDGNLPWDYCFWPEHPTIEDARRIWEILRLDPRLAYMPLTDSMFVMIEPFVKIAEDIENRKGEMGHTIGSAEDGSDGMAERKGFEPVRKKGRYPARLWRYALVYIGGMLDVAEGKLVDRKIDLSPS